MIKKKKRKKVNSVPEGIAHCCFDPSTLKTFSRLKLKQAPNMRVQSCFLQSDFTRDEEQRKMPILALSAQVNTEVSGCGSKPGSPQL